MVKVMKERSTGIRSLERTAHRVKGCLGNGFGKVAPKLEGRTCFYAGHNINGKVYEQFLKDSK